MIIANGGISISLAYSAVPLSLYSYSTMYGNSRQDVILDQKVLGYKFKGSKPVYLHNYSIIVSLHMILS